MLIFALPMILGNLLQQVYNIADTMVVGRFLGAEALAAVGSAYTLMTFLTSVIIGLCMGQVVLFFIAYGAGNQQELKKSIWVRICWNCYNCHECNSIYLDKTNSETSADTGGGLSSDVSIYTDHFFRDSVCFFI